MFNIREVCAYTHYHGIKVKIAYFFLTTMCCQQMYAYQIKLDCI
jgi:hypothetical protein